MTWLVFGVSCLLVLAGAISIISGAPIIQLERGWAEVISGTVALSSGGVVFALAGILMRLEAIRDTMAARTLPVAAESVPVAPATAPAETPPQTAAEPVLVTPPPPVPTKIAAVSAPDDDAKTEGLWKRVKRPEVERSDAEGTDADQLRQSGFPDRIVPDDKLQNPSIAAAPVVVPAHPVPVDVPAPTISSAPIDLVGSEATPENREPQIGWLERSLFKGRAARGDTGPGRPEPELAPMSFDRTEGHDARPEPVLGPLTDQSAARSPQFSAPEPTVAAEPTPTPDLASEQHDGTAVIGRYQAGSASYVMYSDGTIEVETESGEIHRFGSMDELKAFIAQQDTAVS